MGTVGNIGPEETQYLEQLLSGLYTELEQELSGSASNFKDADEEQDNGWILHRSRCTISWKITEEGLMSHLEGKRDRAADYTIKCQYHYEDDCDKCVFTIEESGEFDLRNKGILGDIVHNPTDESISID